MDSKPPPGAPQPPPTVSAPAVSAAHGSKAPFKLGIGPILVVATIALAAGFLIGKHASGSDGTSAGSTPPPANAVPTAQSDAAALQRRASDAEAKSGSVTAAEAMETCATDNQGSYAGCGSDDLVAVEPTLADLGDRLEVSGSRTSYRISVGNASTGNVFTLERKADGTVGRSCTAAGIGGCQAGGIW